MPLSRDKMPDTSGHWKLCDFVPKLPGDDDADWANWSQAFIMGVTAIDPRFKEIIDGTLRAPGFYLNQSSSDVFLSADETKSPHDMAAEDNEAPRAAIIEDSRAFTQLNAMGSILLRMSLGPVPMELISDIPDLKAAYHALSCKYGRYNHHCEYGACDNMKNWLDVKFRKGDHPSEFLEEWQAALDVLLFDHNLGIGDIFNVFIDTILDHDEANKFFSLSAV